MDAPNFGRRTKGQGDPLLTDFEDKGDTMDSFNYELGAPSYDLLGPSEVNSFEFDLSSLAPNLSSLEPNPDIGSWFQNTSMHLENEGDVSLTEGSGLLSVNPESIMPSGQSQSVQPPLGETPSQTEIGTNPEMDSPNSAAMRLHANCSNMEDVKTVIVQQQPAQQAQHIQLLTMGSMPLAANSGTIVSTNTTIHSPMKANTTAIILDGNGTFSVAGTTYIASPQKVQTVSSGSQKLRTVLTPSQSSPVLLGHLQSGVTSSNQRPIAVAVTSPLKHTNIVQHHSEPTQTVTSVQRHHHKLEEKVYPKPVFSYSCLIALALKNSKTGNLPVSEIYNFMCENFPYFKTAPDGWKNSVRHNLSLNKCFAKVDNPKLSSGAKKGCLWALNPAKVKKMEDEIVKWGKKDPVLLLNSMAYPENLEAIEKGQAGLPFRKDSDSEEDENVLSPVPCSPVKKENISTSQKHVDEYVINEYNASPIQSSEMEQEYVSHAFQWGIHDTNVEDLHIDLLTSSPLTSSPITTSHGSPLTHTSSRSVSRHGVNSPYQNNFLSSPSYLQHASSPSSVRANLFNTSFTPPRTLSALN